MSFNQTYEQALAKAQANRKPRKAMSRGSKGMSGRKRWCPRRVSKKATSDGDSEKLIRDECDELVRKILHLRATSRTGEICFIVGCYQSKDLHVSHYIKRGILALRWRLDNCHLMCDSHNEQHNYNTKLYRQAMNLWYGIEKAEELERIGKENPRLEYVDLLTIRDGLRAELARMKS